jgi:hypothetical protein
MSQKISSSNLSAGKNILKRHLPFIQKTLKIVKNTELQEKWQKMLEIITSERR